MKISPANSPRQRLIFMLVSLTILFIVAQIIVFAIHYKMSSLIDTLINSSISSELIYPAILMPVLGFITIQLIAYGLFVAWIWFISVSLGELMKYSENAQYWLGIILWCCGCIAILTLNNYLFSHSFFAQLLREFVAINSTVNTILLMLTASSLLLATVLAYVHFFRSKHHRRLGGMLLMLGFCVGVTVLLDKLFSLPLFAKQANQTPNVILIGLDSVRPDFTGYFGSKNTRTPNIDHFLRSAATFSDAYTPLARTYPAWISILTAKHPKHSHARMNLIDPALVLENDSLVKHMKAVGYETIFGMDERRFADINEQYGFDRIIGPKRGVVDFVLGGISDFPLSNLLINLPVGRYLFPYNYGNRAINITYEPDNFLQLVRVGLLHRAQKPLFLAVHLCVAHWPFTWASDGQSDQLKQAEKYRHSVEKVDAQFGQLLQILSEAGLLERSIVVLLSDHGTTVGLPGDRLVAPQNYHGDKEKLKRLAVAKLNSAPAYSLDFKHDYTINTSYGQGNDTLSLKQYQVLLAFKGYGIDLPIRQLNERSSLMDIAPTLLAVLKLTPLQKIDGISLTEHAAKRAFFIETGDSLAEIETDHIQVEKVINKKINAYRINTNTGALFLDEAAGLSILKNKQRAILWGDWLLAQYPAGGQLSLAPLSSTTKSALTLKTVINQPYFVLANLKTNQWTIGLSSSFAKSAPLPALLRQFNAFYGNEIYYPLGATT